MSRSFLTVVIAVVLIGFAAVAWLMGGWPSNTEGLAARAALIPEVFEPEDGAAARPRASGRSSTSDDSSLKRLESGFQRLKQQVQQVQAEQARLQTQQRELAQRYEDLVRSLGASDGQTPSDDVSAHEEDASNTGPMPSDDELLAARREHLDQELAMQPADEEWSLAAAEQIATAVGEAMLEGSQLLQAECRTTLCRAEVVHESKADLDLFMERFHAALSWQTNSRNHTTNYQDGRVETVVYLAREGYSLPKQTSEYYP